MKFLLNRGMCLALAVMLCLAILPFCAYASAEETNHAEVISMWYGDLSGKISGNFTGATPICFDDLVVSGTMSVYDAVDPDNQEFLLKDVSHKPKDKDHEDYGMLRGKEFDEVKLEMVFAEGDGSKSTQMWSCTLVQDPDAPETSIVVKKPYIDESGMVEGKVVEGTSVLTGFGAKGTMVYANVRLTQGKIEKNEAKIGEDGRFTIDLKSTLKNGDRIIVMYKNEADEFLPFNTEYEVIQQPQAPQDEAVSVEINLEADSIPPVITTIVKIGEEINGACSKGKIEVLLMTADESKTIETVTSAEDGSFKFISGNWLDIDEQDFVAVAVDAAGNKSEPQPIFIMTGSSDAESDGIEPVVLEVKQDPDYPDDPEKIILLISAEPKEKIKLNIRESGSDNGEDVTVETDANGSYTIKKDSNLIKTGRGYIVTAEYKKNKLAKKSSPAVIEFYHDASVPVITEINTELTLETKQISGMVSEPSTVYLMLNGVDAQKFEVKEVNGRFYFEITPDSSVQYSVRAVDTCENIGGPIDLMFAKDPVIISSITVTGESSISSDDKLKVKCWVLAEKPLENLSLRIDDIIVGSVELAEDAELLDILNGNTDYNKLGNFVYCASFEGEISVADYKIGEHELVIEYKGSDSKPVVIENVSSLEGTFITIVEGSSESGKLAFVLALLVLALVACITVMIIIGRRIKFLQGASLDDSNESNITARFKSQM